MIKTAVDTDAIGKYIGNELYKLSLKKNITQSDIAKKLDTTPGYISLLFTGRNTTKNIEKYWRIAEAIPISRKDFDEIVEEAKRKVLGVEGGGVSEDPEVAYATLARTHGVSAEDVKKAMEMYKVWKS